MPPEQKREVESIVDQRIAFSRRMVGDTPTDSNQLIPKKYLSSVISSISQGFTFTNLIVTGSASVVGKINAGSIDTTGNASVAGSMGVGGTLVVGGNASVSGTVFAASANFGSATIGGVAVPATYLGTLSSSGVQGSPFPAGWGSSVLGVGLYQVQHNFGASNYIALVTAGTFVATIQTRGTNSFNIQTLNSAGSAQNDVTYFTVSK